MKPIPVTIKTKDPSLGFYENGEGDIIGHIKKGDFYTTPVLKALGMSKTDPVESNFDVFIIKRLDKDSMVIVPREFLNKLIILNKIEDYNELQKYIEKGSYVLDKFLVEGKTKERSKTGKRSVASKGNRQSGERGTSRKESKVGKKQNQPEKEATKRCRAKEKKSKEVVQHAGTKTKKQKVTERKPHTARNTKSRSQ